MALVLPTRTDLARYTFDIDLDDVKFAFSFEWNDRDSGWYMSIATPEGVPLLSGRRVVLGYPLISIYRTDGMPAGNIVAIDTSSANEEPGFGDLGDRVKLLYMTRAELGI
jgi:hypothetical protein